MMKVGSVPNSTQSEEAPNIRPEDIIIAIMGITGAGKTSFIKSLTDRDLKVGNNLTSCTEKVEIVRSEMPNGQSIVLVDTPGFDDTSKNDVDILLEISDWLEAAYHEDVKLSGIIYLHQIHSTRMGGTAMKNLRVFKKLCGDECLGSVVLGTTMWPEGEKQMARCVAREKELCEGENFWKPMIQSGSRVFRHDRGKVSAMEIVDYLIGKRRRVFLSIQEERSKGIQLHETGAGKELEGDYEKMKEEYEKKITDLEERMDTAMKKKEFEWRDQLEKMKQGYEKQVQLSDENLRKLQSHNEQLLQGWEQQRAAQQAETARRIAALEEENKKRGEKQEQRHKNAMEIQRLQLELRHMEEKEREKEQEAKAKKCIVM